MTLAEKIQKDLTDAMRAKDELRLSVLRGIKSAITYKETEKIRKLDEPESIQLLQTLVKQRKESVEQFTTTPVIAPETIVPRFPLISSIALARTQEAMHNSRDKNDTQVILHLLKAGLTPALSRRDGAQGHLERDTLGRSKARR